MVAKPRTELDATTIGTVLVIWEVFIFTPFPPLAAALQSKVRVLLKSIKHQNLARRLLHNHPKHSVPPCSQRFDQFTPHAETHSPNFCPLRLELCGIVLCATVSSAAGSRRRSDGPTVEETSPGADGKGTKEMWPAKHLDSPGYQVLVCLC